MSIERLCEWAQVSRSGFYKYLNRISSPNNKELQDRADFELILEAYNYRSFKKGSRSIFMRLLRNGHPMSRNKIRRLMIIYFAQFERLILIRKWLKHLKKVV